MNELNVLVKSSRGVIEFQNYQEIKQQIKKELEKYQNLTLTEDNKKDIKKLEQDLNKVVKLLSDERISIKKDFNKPLEEFEAKVKDISDLIKVTVSDLEVQIKAQEDAQKEDKRIELESYLDTVKGDLDFINLSHIIDNITLTTTIKKYQQEIDTFLEKVKSDIEVINANPNATRILGKYRLSLDLNKSILAVKTEIEQENIVAQKETKKVEEKNPFETIQVQELPFEPKKEKVLAVYNMYLSSDDMVELENFLRSKKITYQKEIRK